MRDISCGILVCLTLISIVIVGIIVYDEFEVDNGRTQKIIRSCATGSVRGMLMGAVTNGVRGAILGGAVAAVIAPVMIIVEGIIIGATI